jgi:hypothetical protein
MSASKVGQSGTRPVAPGGSGSQQVSDAGAEVQPFVVPSARKALKKHRTELRATSARIAKLVAQDRYQVCSDLRAPYEHTLDGFAYLLQTGEQITLSDALKVTPEEIEDARAFMREEACNLDNVRAFATKWAKAMGTDAGKAELLALPWGKRVDTFIANFNTASKRISCYHTTVKNFATEEPQAEYDIAKQTNGFVANAASRSMWGKSGAAKAVQDQMTKTFKKRLMGLKRQFGNIVGNAHVSDSYVVPITEEMKRNGQVPRSTEEPLVVGNSAGPNPKHSTGTRVKVPRLSHLRHPDSVSERQEGKLDAAYASDYEGRRLYNLQATALGLKTVTHMAVTPKSSGVFGYPKAKAAEVLARRTLFTMSQDPDLEIKMLTVNAIESAESFAAHAGVKVKRRKPVLKASGN